MVINGINKSSICFFMGLWACSAVTVVLLQKLDLMSIDISSELQKIGIHSVFIPSDDPYEYWDDEKKEGRAIFSHKHAGELAGLGRIGQNALLFNKEYGNMFMLSSILTDAELEPDDLITEEYCRENCNLCIDNCPGNALGEFTMTQKACRPLSLIKNEKGFDLKGCFVCRQICPNNLGDERK